MELLWLFYGLLINICTFIWTTNYAFSLSLLLNCFSFIIIILRTPLLILVYSIFSTYPALLNTCKYMHGFNNLKTLFFSSFLYVFIMLSFLANVLSYANVGHRAIQKILFNHCIHLNLIIQTCILLNPLLNYLLLLLCGDIESNPGPTLLSQNVSVCCWNLNGIAAQNYTKLSQLLAYNAVYNYDVICLGETFLDSSYLNDDQLLKLSGYQLIRADCPNNTKKGGVAMLYKESRPLKIRNDISPLKNNVWFVKLM